MSTLMEGSTVEDQNFQRWQRALIFLVEDADDPVELLFRRDEDQSGNISFDEIVGNIVETRSKQANRFEFLIVLVKAKHLPHWRDLL